MKFFRKEIQLNPGHVMSEKITIECRRYLPRERRWRLVHESGFQAYRPLNITMGSKLEIKEELKRLQC